MQYLSMQSKQLNNLNKREYIIYNKYVLNLYKQFNCIKLQAQLNIGSSFPKMHQISVQQLAIAIPKPINQWKSEDVCTWLALNEVDISNHTIVECNKDLKNMSPYDWIRSYGVTKFIASQIVSWMEDEGEQFDSIFQDRKQQLSSNINDKPTETPDFESRQQKINQIYQNLLGKPLQNNKNNQAFRQNQIETKNNLIRQSNSGIIINQLNLQPKSKSSLCIQQSAIQSHSQVSQLSSEKSIEENSSSSEGSIDQNCEAQQLGDQVQSLKSQGKVSEQDDDKYSQMIKLSTQQTERISTPYNNKQILKQEIYQNQSMNAAKFLKKKKDDMKAINERLKIKNKQLNSKDPKLYNYINSNVITESANIKKTPQSNKRISSVQEIPFQQKISKQEVKKRFMIPLLISSAHVKFTSSQFIPFHPQGPKRRLSLIQKKIKVTALTAQNTLYQNIIFGNALIGRSIKNQIILVDESVSRSHAQIIPEIQMSGQTKYYLKDVGSRFGTFVQCKNIQENIQGRSFLIGNAEIFIISAQISKSNNNSNLHRSKYTIDVKVRIDNQKQLTLTNRASITIGKRQSNDIRIENNCQNARIYVQKDKKIYLEATQGKLYEKLNQNQLWEIQNYLDHSKKVEVVFGWLKVNFQFIQTCLSCSKFINQCNCNITKAVQGKN